MNQINVISKNQKWAVKLENAKGISKFFYGGKKEACVWAAGRLLQAGGGLLVVHGRDGSVDETWMVWK